MPLIRAVWWLLKCLCLFAVAAAAPLFVAALPGRRAPSLLLLQLFNFGFLPNGFSAATRSVCPPPSPPPLIRHLCRYLNPVSAPLSLALITANYPQQKHEAALRCSVTPTFHFFPFFLCQHFGALFHPVPAV